MTQEDFLEQKIFTGLTNKNNNEGNTDFYFSEEDFAKVLEKTAYFGIAIYTITAINNGKEIKTVEHETFRKKATDAKWYNREFKNLKREQEGLLFTATYKVSKKLLARDFSSSDKES